MISATIFMMGLCLARAAIIHRKLKDQQTWLSPYVFTTESVEARIARLGHLYGAATSLIILVWGLFFSWLGLP